MGNLHEENIVSEQPLVKKETLVLSSLSKRLQVMMCGYDPKSSLYNTWQSRKATEGQWSSAENMAISAYNYGFVINYNTQRVPGNGSAIFFHISSGATLGCVGTSQSNVVSILKWLNPAKSPTIIMTPSSELGSY